MLLWNAIYLTPHARPCAHFPNHVLGANIASAEHSQLWRNNNFQTHTNNTQPSLQLSLNPKAFGTNPNSNNTQGRGQVQAHQRPYIQSTQRPVRAGGAVKDDRVHGGCAPRTPCLDDVPLDAQTAGLGGEAIPV
jgi:hypothetical protein